MKLLTINSIGSRSQKTAPLCYWPIKRLICGYKAGSRRDRFLRDMIDPKYLLALTPPGRSSSEGRYVKTRKEEVPSAACEEKIEFVASYAAFVSAYYASVAELEQLTICKSKELFSMQLRSTEKARIMCEKARKRLEDHLSIHGC